MKLETNRKDIFFYLIICFILIGLSVCNNIFWKLGKQVIDNASGENNNTYLESNNIIYDVSFDEEWLD